MGATRALIIGAHHAHVKHSSQGSLRNSKPTCGVHVYRAISPVGRWNALGTKLFKSRTSWRWRLLMSNSERMLDRCKWMIIERRVWKACWWKNKFIILEYHWQTRTFKYHKIPNINSNDHSFSLNTDDKCFTIDVENVICAWWFTYEGASTIALRSSLELLVQHMCL